MNALMRELAPYVGRICGAIALSDGDDAMQETMIAVLKNLPGLRDPDALHGWVRRIAVRESMRLVNARRPDVEATETELATDLPDLDQQADVAAVLRSLPPEHRAVLVLRDLDGLSQAEAAAVFRVPEGTVKSRLHRARAAFRERWAP
jgi:RNA polymerase sigma factor (sigma-70 family)